MQSGADLRGASPLVSFNYMIDLHFVAFSSTGVCGQGMSNMFAAPPIKYFKIFFRLSIPKHNPNPNLKP